MRPWFIAESASYPRPSRAIACGRMECTSTSASPARRRSAALPSAPLRSRTTLPLVAIQMDEERPRSEPGGAPARRKTSPSWGLDLDDIGPEISEDLSRERSHDDGREVEDSNTCQRRALEWAWGRSSRDPHQLLPEVCAGHHPKECLGQPLKPVEHVLPGLQACHHGAGQKAEQSPRRGGATSRKRPSPEPSLGRRSTAMKPSTRYRPARRRSRARCDRR